MLERSLSGDSPGTYATLRVALFLAIFSTSGPSAATLPTSVLSRSFSPAIAVGGAEKCDGQYKNGGRPPSEELLRILEAHFKWKVGGDTAGQRAKLCGADLTAVDLHPLAVLAQRNALSSFLASGNKVVGAERLALRGADLRQANLAGADISHLDFGEADLTGSVLTKTNLNGTAMAAALLDGANLHGANLIGAGFQGASLIRADLSEAVMTGARLDFANLSEANLAGTDLSGATLGYSNLTNATLHNAVLSGSSLQAAELRGTDLSGLVFELQPGALPSILGIAFAKNLSEMTFRESPLSLVEVRDEFRKKELRQQEREITFAIRRTERLQGWKRGGWRQVESVVNLILLEYPYQYGMSPWRPLALLAGSVLIFTIIYVVFLVRSDHEGTRARQSRIIVIQIEDQPGLLLSPLRHHGRMNSESKTWLIRRVWHYVYFGVWFSTLSALQIPWKELDVGNLIARLQPWRTLRASGWVRTVSGIQSLVSTYLLILWVIAYFRRLFE